MRESVDREVGRRGWGKSAMYPGRTGGNIARRQCLRQEESRRSAVGLLLLLPPKMHEQPPEVLRVLLDAVVERLDLLLLQEPDDLLLELAGALAGDDLHHRRLLRDRLVDYRSQGAVDVGAAVVDVVQVELELHIWCRPGE